MHYFAQLNELAKADDILLEMDIYGGVAFMLAYDLRAATKDVDAVVRPEAVAKRYIVEVARRNDLPEDWLNSKVQQFLSPLKKATRPLDKVADFSNIRINVPTANYLLALKAMACRDPLGKYEGDYGDLRFLIKKLEIKAVSQIQAAIDEFYPDDQMDERRMFIMQDLIEQAYEK